MLQHSIYINTSTEISTEDNTKPSFLHLHKSHKSRISADSGNQYTSAEYQCTLHNNLSLKICGTPWMIIMNIIIFKYVAQCYHEHPLNSYVM